jgi:hypothetical protein
MEPRDPRQDLDPEAREAAEAILAALGAEKPARLDRAEKAWFEREIRPLLPRWAAYAARFSLWEAREHARLAARFRRETRRRLADVAGAPRPAFAPGVLRGLERLGFLAPAEEAG